MVLELFHPRLGLFALLTAALLRGSLLLALLLWGNIWFVQQPSNITQGDFIIFIDEKIHLLLPVLGLVLKEQLC